ncbi:MAG TPA: hypothetical protein VK629_13360 [Steroidobacteraceae bacterium]|nr:hypothetical protein [Steroidobacteraceae bacterium]
MSQALTLAINVRFEELRSMVLAIVASAAIAGCGSYERASLTITYDQASQPAEWRFDGLARKRVEDSLKTVSQASGYQCSPNFKRPEETDCTGPLDLYLTFKPVLNKSEFIAVFSWVDSGDRTHEEFIELVSEFKRNIGAAVGESNVLIAATN